MYKCQNCGPLALGVDDNDRSQIDNSMVYLYRSSKERVFIPYAVFRDTALCPYRQSV